ncbi:glycosyltransferase involved in cell wall biosynthesis [Algisphaera agarilytica]|uniref:Glycosyltransferase involved in cell wall biosynthesis n=2 Tax=Algisphaera agarilytica TaxID=1385975 RepID=A0A7X0LLY1_9BACT|nr:glycosyltransferase involved in cell wall biosynthesis [Algisphaera agarilytica]
MRINFVLPEATRAGGVRVVATYAQRLAERGHEVTVVSMPRRLPWNLRLRRGLKGQGFSSIWNHPQTYFDDLDNVTHHIIEQPRPIVDADLPDADVTIATWWKTADWVNDLSPSKGAKVYFIQHDERHVHGTAEGVIPTWKLPLHKILVAQWLDPVLRAEGVTDDLEVVPNAVDAEKFQAPSRGKQAKPTVGLMYSDSHFKGADVSLAAFEKARQQLPGLELVAFGKDDPYRDMPLPQGARYEQDPTQETIREVYASCDAWLFASRCEGFGLPILEAMACRTPVIATPAGAAPELVGQGGGVMVGMEDVDAMAKAILEVVRLDDTAWRAMSDRAHATATSYTWDDATDAFERSLRHAAGQPNESRKELACTR